MSAKEAYVEKANAQISEWGAQISLLMAKSRNRSASASVDYEERLAQAKMKRKGLQKKLEECELVVGEAWDQAKVGLETAWKDVQAAFDHAAQ